MCRNSSDKLLDAMHLPCEGFSYSSCLANLVDQCSIDAYGRWNHLHSWSRMTILCSAGIRIPIHHAGDQSLTPE